MTADTKNILPLTGIRAIAAYMVFVHHFIDQGAPYLNKYVLGFLSEFQVGVSLFFVLSGFLITYRYYDHTISYRTYFANRFARIYPMFFLLTCLYFAVDCLLKGGGSMTELRLFLLNITLVKGFFNQYKFSGIAASWSLTVEEMFYLGAPLFFAAIRRWKGSVLLMPAALAASGFLLSSICSGYDNHGFFNPTVFMLHFTFPGLAFSFFAGMGAALYFRRKEAPRRTRFLTTGSLLVIALCIFGISLLKDGSTSGVYHPAGLLINHILLPVFGFAPLLVALATERNCFTRLLSGRLIILLGKSSYIFYLIHYTLAQYLLQRLTGSLFVSFLLLNIIAVFLYRYAEQPINSYLRRRWSRAS